MKLHLMIAATAVAAFAATGVMAQQDPIAARKALMKGTGAQAGLGAKFLKGEEAFDLAKAKAIFATFEKTAAEAPALFPADSKTGGETGALPAVWEKMDDFKAKLAKLGVDAKAAGASVKDLDSFKAAFPGVTKNCGGCHETYRVKKS